MHIGNAVKIRNFAVRKEAHLRRYVVCFLFLISQISCRLVEESAVTKIREPQKNLLKRNLQAKT